MSTSDDSLYWACLRGDTELSLELANSDNADYIHASETYFYGDTPLHRACKRGCLDIVKLLIEKYGCDPNVRNKHQESVLHYSCRYGHIDIVKYLIDKQHSNPLLRDNVDQSEPLDYALNNNQTAIAVYLCQHCISSDEMLNPNRIKTTINLISYILRVNSQLFATPESQSQLQVHGNEAINPNEWKTADGDNILQFVGSSKTFASHTIQLAVVLEILSSDSAKCITFNPDYTTSDGDNILELVCQSEIYLSQTPSGLILKWLGDTIINRVTKSIPDSKTVDGKIIIQLICQSEVCISHISTSVLSKWLSDTTIIQKVAKIMTPEWKTADGDTLLQVVCQSETIVSRISSTVLTKWLSDSTATLDLMKKIVTPDLRTADSITLFQLICQSEKCLIQTSSTVFLKWLEKIPLEFVSVSIPDCKTADGDTLLQLVLYLEMSLSQTSSIVLLKLLDNSRDLPINQMKMVDPNWKTLDGVHLLHSLCKSKVKDKIIIELMQHYIQQNDLNPNIFLDSEENTALHIACQTSRPALVSYLINEARCESNIKNKAKRLPLDMTTNLEVINCLCRNDQVAIFSKTVTGWMNNKLIDTKTMLQILQLLIDNHRYSTDDGSTLLHVVCTSTHIKISLIDYLLINGHFDPNCLNSDGQMPLQLTSDLSVIQRLVEHGAKVTTDVVFKVISSNLITDSRAAKLIALSTRKGTMSWHPTDLNSNGYTALHIACKLSKPAIVNYLLKEAKCDPNIITDNRRNPLQLTSDSNIMQSLVEHGTKVPADVVFKVISSKDVTELRAIELFEFSITKKTMLWDPCDLNSEGHTALELACKLEKQAIMNYLFTKCDPNAILESTTKLETAKMLIKRGARVTPGLVLRFLAMDTLPSERKSLTELMLTTWNPDDRDNDGYTALHLACKIGHPSRVNLLLSIAHCDPNIKSNNEEVPLQMTTNPEIIKDLIRHGAKTSIMYESHKNLLGTNKPVQPPVKVFIVGNPSVGKSTLTAALKTKLGIRTRIFSRKVSGVDRKTIGIVPHDLESSAFGPATLYDFAGHREFYSGHAALLQTAIQSTPPIFLLVVDLSEKINEIIKNILYWTVFLENQCASVSCKPYVILVGSHADTLKGISAKDKVKMIVDSLNMKCFVNMEYIGFVAMNCQYHESTGMNDLRRLLTKSCERLRIQEPITFNAHCFLVFLIETFINLTAITIKAISDEIKNQQRLLIRQGVLEFLPRGDEALYKICLELNDRGHILLLKDRIAAENSYIVIDKEFLLSKISGTVFAPEDFRQHKELSTNTGVVPLSKIAECFPDKDLDILIGFLTHLEFCHEISDESLHQLISEQYSLVFHEHYYLFPGLISVKADDTIWQVQSTEYDYNFGWILKCIHLEQFFSSRFLQVLLLRLAFSFALKVSCENPNRSIGIHRNCFIWKNGIFWGRTFAMQTLVEVAPDNKSVLLLARFQEDDLLQCVQHRSEIISTILQCKEQFCPRVQAMEVFLDSSAPHQYPLNLPNELNVCTLQDLATAVVSDSKSRRVVLQFSTIPATTFLSFEPYLEMKVSTIQELWDEKKEKKIISETFITKFVQKATDKLSSLIKTLTESSMSSTSDDQLYRDLLRWRDSDKTNKRTYKDLRQLMDQYSVFAGRNVLELTCTKLLRPMEEEHKQEQEQQEEQGEVKQEVKEHLKIQEEKGNDDDEDEKPQYKLRVHGNKPKLHQLQLLNFPDGTELRIMEKLAPKWKQVAVALGFDGARIETIEMGALRQPEDASLKIFTGWLEGGHDLQPPTWDVLIQSIRAVKLTEIADLLSKTIKIEAEDTSASNTLSTTAVDTESQVSSSTATPDIINCITNNKATAKSSEFENSVSPLNIEDELTEPSQADVQGPSIATILNIKALEEIEGRGGRKVRVIDSIDSQWEEVAKALDMGQEDIDMIKTTHSDNDEEACREMLATWLEGNNGEASWTVFSQALIDAGLPELADSLKDVLKCVL